MFFNKFVALLALAGAALGVPTSEHDTREPCSPIQVVHLAGSGEEGLGQVGTPLAAALKKSAHESTIYSLPYNTSYEYVTTLAEGAAMNAKYLTTQASKCSRQRFVLSGYSKGAMVIHATNLTDTVKSKVLAIVTFGDPYHNTSTPWPINSPVVNLTPNYGTKASQNIASFCNDGDPVCQPGGKNITQHIAYGWDNRQVLGPECAVVYVPNAWSSTTIAADFIRKKL